MKLRKLLLAVFAIGVTMLPMGANAQNLIVNGNFESGVAGFGTDYQVSSSGCIGCVGVAATTQGWYNAPGYVFPFNDHTTGSGKMLQYDPPNGTHTRIWYQSVNVVAGTTYVFEGWVREANSEPSPNNGLVGVYANGVFLGQQRAEDNIWSNWSFNYTATFTGSIELALRDLYPTTYYGTYSAIDDLNFSAVAAPVPEPDAYAMMMAGLGLLGFMARRKRRAA